MKLVLIYALALAVVLTGLALSERSPIASVCWCWPPTHKTARMQTSAVGHKVDSVGSYGSEADWGDPTHIIPLDYSQDQCKRLFYQYCVWCHAESTPAGPSNRSNLTSEAPLLNDPAFIKNESDAALERVIALGGGALGKSEMMPPYGSTLSANEIHDLIQYMRKLTSSVPAQASSNTQATTGSNAQ